MKFQPLVVLPQAAGMSAFTLAPLIAMTAGPLPAAVAGALLPKLGSELWPSRDHAAVPAPDGQLSAARGKAIFVAKGCITCHYHGELADSNSIGFGPDLTRYQSSVEFLQLWLDNPPAVKPMTKMPDLGLQTAEIDALAAFLTKQ